MGTWHARILALGFTAAILISAANGQTTNSQSDSVPTQTPVLINTCIISSDIKELVAFYEQVLGSKAKWSGDSYAEFPTGAGVLAIFSSTAQERYIPNVTEPGKNRSVILEFKVTDVDQEYARLKSIVKVWVKPPSTQPWGMRSIYFRDPDGNLVDFFTMAKR